MESSDGVLVMCGQCQTFCSMRQAMECLDLLCFFHCDCAALQNMCQGCWDELDKIDMGATRELFISNRASKRTSLVSCITNCKNENVKCIGGGWVCASGTKYRYKCTNCNAQWQQFPPGREVNGDPCITTRRYKQHAQKSHRTNAFQSAQKPAFVNF